MFQSTTNHSACIEVCAAVIQRQGKYLLAQRPAGKHLAGKWEFPGGKVHPGETCQACIIRELDEELALHAVALRLLTTIEHIYPEKCIRLHFLACTVAGNATHEPREHLAVDWFALNDLAGLDLAPADRRFVAWLQAANGATRG